jgi:hypothetical protein
VHLGDRTRSPTTIRYPNEWQFSADHGSYVLRFVDEIWDADAFGFWIECSATDKSYLELRYNSFPQKLADQMKKKKQKPTLVIRSNRARLMVLGEITDIEHELSGDEFTYRILNSVDVKSIFTQKDVVRQFPNKTYRPWRSPNANEIVKFFDYCGVD